MLAFLEKLTLQPEDLDGHDAAELWDAGVSEEAAEKAIAVAALFGMMDRLADTLDFYRPDQAEYRRGAKYLLRFGYKI